MRILLSGFTMELKLLLKVKDSWQEIGADKATLTLQQEENFISYQLKTNLNSPGQIRISLDLLDEEKYYHIIPCNIYGDNNVEHVGAGEFPILTDKIKDNLISCSNTWEFRADRASHPVSILCCENGAVGISIPPYCTDEGSNFVRNGLFASLPNTIGVSIGYTNYPTTFNNKRTFLPSTHCLAESTTISGKIYAFRGDGRQEAHKIARSIYQELRKVPEYKKNFTDAIKGILNSFITINWSEEMKEYANCECKLPMDPKLKAWRPLVEIGWTGGGVLGYPFALAQHILGLSKDYFGDRKDSTEILDAVAAQYNEKSGLLNDIIRPWHLWPNSKTNGWWSNFGLVEDRHGAYTNGSAVFYLLRTYRYLKLSQNDIHSNWLTSSLKVLDTILSLQREDGNYGFSYSCTEKKVEDWDGFAGCWFVGAMAYAYLETKEDKYLDSAKRAMNYYSKFVHDINVWGTPMDTWKSVDEEGNLAFIRAAHLLHSITKEDIYLQMLEQGAEYEYLWKYCYEAVPEYPPLKGSRFNSCGGNITSISNPHMHPMGLMVATDLYYLYQCTGDTYHLQRYEDTISWAMHILELYPEVTGYGAYGVLTERFCPTDGLIQATYADNQLGSMWFTFNGWAAANTLEGICEAYLLDSKIIDKLNGGTV